MRRLMQILIMAAACLGGSLPVLAQGGSPVRSPFQRAVTLRQQGKVEQAAAAFRKILDEQPSNDLAWLNLAICAHIQEDYEGALEAYAKAAAFPRARPTALYNSACAHALMGDTEPALEALQAAIEAGFSNASLVNTDSDLDSLRDHDRFRSIVDGIGQPLSRRLHFWIGQWDCYSATSGLINGRNDLVARLGENVIHENWTPAGGGAGGESWNYFDPQSRTWRQHWMNSNGQPFVFVGTPKDKGILFEGPHLDGKDSQLRRRMFIRPIGNGRVQQTGTQSADGGATWQPEYDLVYVPRGEAFKADSDSQPAPRETEPASSVTSRPDATAGLK